MRRSRVVVAAGVVAILVASAVVVSARGSAGDPVRVGVLVDCKGFVAQTKEPLLAGASLPLLDHGGARHEDGSVTGAEIAGRKVELVPACTEYTEFNELILATRQLIEDKGVDVVIGPIGGSEGVVLRDLAARYPDVTFLEGPTNAQEATLRDPQPNVFRFIPDGAQGTAGLGTYAYRDLGWRRAVVVGEDFSDGWELAAGFVAEFCALGGDVVERDWYSLLVPDPSAAARRHAAEADGALVVSELSPATYLAAYGKEVGKLRSRLLLGGSVFSYPGSLSPPGVDLTGVVLGWYIPLDPNASAMRALMKRVERDFPELPPGPATELPLVPAYTAMGAVASALERTGGELGDGQGELRAALSSLELTAPQGVVRLDRNRQAIVPNYLERISRSTTGDVELEPVRTIRDVSQDFGGIFTARTPRPSETSPACTRRRPPPWAG